MRQRKTLQTREIRRLHETVLINGARVFTPSRCSTAECFPIGQITADDILSPLQTTRTNSNTHDLYLPGASGRKQTHVSSGSNVPDDKQRRASIASPTRPCQRSGVLLVRLTALVARRPHKPSSCPTRPT